MRRGEDAACLSLLNTARLRWKVRRPRRREHTEPLKKHHGPLRRAPPNQLAAIAVAVLNQHVSAGVFQTAILELAVDEHTLVKNHVLAFKSLALVAVHAIPRHVADMPDRALRKAIIRPQRVQLLCGLANTFARAPSVSDSIHCRKPLPKYNPPLDSPNSLKLLITEAIGS